MLKKTVDVIQKPFTTTKSGQVLVERYKFLGITFYTRETVILR